MISKQKRCKIGLSVLILTACAGSTLAGPLSPPAGPVLPSMKTLQDIEPRTPINSITCPGDNDALPSVFKITQSGSYYLPGNLTAVATKIAIEVAADNVTIDLNGFTIRDGLAGIAYIGVGADITVRNGTLRDCANGGIVLSGVVRPRVEQVTVSGCAGSDGFDLGEQAIVVDCTSRGNFNGFTCRGSTSIRGCTAEANSQLGFGFLGSGIAIDGCVAKNNLWTGFLGGEGAFTNCTAKGNGFMGFDTLSNTILTNCVAIGNAEHGIDTGDTCVVRDSVAQGNGGAGIVLSFGGSATGCTARANGGHGIEAASECTVTDNNCSRNGAQTTSGAGIHLIGSGTRVENNQLVANDFGIKADDTDNFIVRNTARGNTSGNFSVIANNEFAPVITNPGTTFTNAAAWSNFAY